MPRFVLSALVHARFDASHAVLHKNLRCEAVGCSPERIFRATRLLAVVTAPRRGLPTTLASSTDACAVPAARPFPGSSPLSPLSPGAPPCGPAAGPTKRRSRGPPRAAERVGSTKRPPAKRRCPTPAPSSRRSTCCCWWWRVQKF